MTSDQSHGKTDASLLAVAPEPEQTPGRTPGKTPGETPGKSNRPTQEHIDEVIRDAILALADERGEAKTLCPSEAARRVDPQDWRRLMGAVRRVAIGLADEGRIQVFRKGKPVDVRTVKGVIRLGLPRG